MTEQSSTTTFDLTPREIEILQLLVNGKTNKEMAAILTVSSKTIEFHLGNLYTKLGVRTRTEAVLWAVQSGLKPKNYGNP